MTRPDGVFNALSDATRRGVIEALVSSPRTPGELAGLLAVSPQALSRHLRHLRRVGLVQAASREHDARVLVYRIRPAALRPLRNWLERVESLWEKQRSSFKDFAERGR